VEQLWNVSESEKRQYFLDGNFPAKYFFDKEQILRLCALVRIHIADQLRNKGGGDIMQLIEFYCKGNGGEGAVPSRRPREASQESLSDTHSSGNSVGDTLRADQIHHNMFQCGNELD
jgi:hypothetical protein